MDKLEEKAYSLYLLWDGFSSLADTTPSALSLHQSCNYLTPNLDMIDLHDKHLTSSHHFTFFGHIFGYLKTIITIVSLALGGAARG